MNPDDYNEQDNAFLTADEFELDGSKLEPYSFTRKTAALALGLRWGKLSAGDVQTISATDPDSGAIVEVQTYAAIERDAAIVLWLCSQPIHEVKSARRNPGAFEDVIDVWAEKRIFGDGMEVKEEAISLFKRIVMGADLSEGRPQGDGPASEKKTQEATAELQIT